MLFYNRIGPVILLSIFNYNSIYYIKKDEYGIVYYDYKYINGNNNYTNQCNYKICLSGIYYKPFTKINIYKINHLRKII